LIEPRDSMLEAPDGAASVIRIGIVADTHGLLRSEVFDAFRGVQHILHAGDVGDPSILDDLSALAPVIAVWGNMDGATVRDLTGEVRGIDIGGMRIEVLHGHQLADYAALPGRFPHARVIVHGHTHLPSNRRIDGVLVLNPGSAGPRRPGKPVTVAILDIVDGEAMARHVHLVP